MKEKLIIGYWRCRQRFQNAVCNFKKDEHGAQDFVAIIILIVIIIGIAAIFRTQLTEAVTATFEQLMEFIEN